MAVIIKEVRWEIVPLSNNHVSNNLFAATATLN